MNAKIFSIINNANKGSFASVKTLTKVNIPLKWGLGRNVTKYTYKMVQIGCNYESSVNRRRGNEGLAKNFVAESLPWGEWLVVDKVITHKEKTYYRVYDYADNIIAQVYYVDGQVATSEQVDVIKAFLKSRAHSSRQGVDKEVRPTNIEESNILSFKCGGNEYNKEEVESYVSAVATK